MEHTLTSLPLSTLGCPIDKTLQAVGGRWATLIVRELLWHSPRRFGELRAALPGISPKTLTAQLRHLEAAGVLTRLAFAEIPPRVEYRLTARGRDLEPILLAMWEWGYDELVPDGPNPLRGTGSGREAVDPLS